jgi:hypothetical protein
MPARDMFSGYLVWEREQAEKRERRKEALQVQSDWLHDVERSEANLTAKRVNRIVTN